MSPLDLLRRVLPEHDRSAGESATPGHRPAQGTTALLRAGLHGLGAGLLTLVPLLLLGTLLWLTTADLELSWSESMLAGLSFWLLGHGVPIVLATGVIGIVPLAMLLLVLWVGAWSAGRATWEPGEHGWQPALRAAAAWAGGYSLLLLAAGALTLTGPMDPHLIRWLAAAIVLPALMAVVGMVRTLDHDEVDEFLERLFVPASVRRGWRPALHTVAVIVAAGTLAAVLAVIVSFGDVWTLQSDLRPGVAGGIILALLQLMSLPNIGLWIGSFVAGPGFSAVEGSAVTWDGSATSLFPMVPVFAAHPPAATYPTGMPLVAGLFVVLGAWLGWQCLAATARLASLRAKALTMLSGAVSTGVLVALLDWIGGGSLGQLRLADIGAPAALFGLAVTGWLLVGAAVVLAWDWRSLD